jgi:ElaB/YqjD/DUF883 family membrane-anchored ribosome-binding protein
MGEASDHIREDIEQTRGRMGETVEAIGYKTDVKSRVKDNISEKKDAVVSRVTGAMPDGQQVKRGAQKVGLSKQNPLGLGIAAAAVGFIVGTLLPSTEMEDERLGEMSDEVGEKAREAGQGALERGKDVAREAVGNTGTQAEEMASSLRDKAQEVGSTSS